ncbi:MAG: helix-turn-helix transcriptional regulator [Clostridia bacterium]|nr:helix-turn-helix transcriptional regulator [Clostridia bacterium]
MKRNELLVKYLDASNGHHIRIYESVPEFSHRDFFEHRHSDFEISYIISGNGIYNLRDGRINIEQGDVFVIGTNQIHCITENSYSTNPLVLLNVQFEPRMIWSPLSNMLPKEYINLFKTKCERVSRDCKSYPKIETLMLSILQECKEQKTGYQIMIKSYLCEIIALLMREFPEVSASVGEKRAQESLISMDNAMTYINENLGNPLSLKEIADFSGFSRTYFSSLFTSLNGLTPWEYITIRRIEKSKELLCNTNLSVLEISGTCGYENLSNFNRMFLRAVGTSPSQYRKRHSKETKS